MPRVMSSHSFKKTPVREVVALGAGPQNWGGEPWRPTLEMYKDYPQTLKKGFGCRVFLAFLYEVPGALIKDSRMRTWHMSPTNIRTHLCSSFTDLGFRFRV